MTYFSAMARYAGTDQQTGVARLGILAPSVTTSISLYSVCFEVSRYPPRVLFDVQRKRPVSSVYFHSCA